MNTQRLAVAGRPFTDATASRGRSPRSFGVRLAGVLDQVVLWQQRASERRHMQAMSDHMIKDIGFSRADIAHEASKPFWRA